MAFMTMRGDDTINKLGGILNYEHHETHSGSFNDTKISFTCPSCERVLNVKDLPGGMKKVICVPCRIYVKALSFAVLLSRLKKAKKKL